VNYNYVNIANKVIRVRQFQRSLLWSGIWVIEADPTIHYQDMTPLPPINVQNYSLYRH